MGAVYTTTGNSTNWDDPAAWDCNCVPSITATPSHTLNINHLIIKTGNIEPTQSTKIIINDGGRLIVNGNVNFPWGTTEFRINEGGYVEATNFNKSNASTTLVIHDTLRVNNDLTIGNNSNITITGDIIVGGTFTLNGGSTISTTGNISAGSMVVSNNTTLRTSEKIVIGNLTLTGSGNIRGTGSVSWDNLSISNNGRFICEVGEVYITEPPYNPLNLQNCNSVLPATFLYVETSIKQEGVLVCWATATEKNNEFFSIERATDNDNSFKSIGKIPGSGSSSEVIEYEYVDYSAEPGNNYYRIKQVDLNGKFDYSYIVHTFKQSSSIVRITNETLFIPEQEKDAFVHIATIDGRVLFQGTVQSKLNLSTFGFEALIIRVTTESQQKTLRYIKL